MKRKESNRSLAAHSQSNPNDHTIRCFNFIDQESKLIVIDIEYVVFASLASFY
jgi:hypothetical protein